MTLSIVVPCFNEEACLPELHARLGAAARSAVGEDYELVLVTNESTIKSKPEIITRFLRAVRRGYEDAAQDPQAGVDILLKGTKAEVDEKIERPGAKLLAPLWKTDKTPFGTQDAAKWESFTQWLQANGLLPKDPALLGPGALPYAHLPGGHQEAWADAFRNVVSDVYHFIADKRKPGDPRPPAFATFEDGYHSARLVDATLDSHRRGGVWTSL